ncbi:hypothetical protein IQ259_00410 [Fortiea sp. LEGE XX443]|uniref:hypothetical protein n=1 Tax=Fortiea sp. LEGE XX443 TaxID=1828611 RepID=UPI0018826EE6|nr:hypothetical protein [Fortiea sp. LEGE XX443]MBE9003532.1 hypothetical protein [Fortiea sp. LEGE XX443]
MKQYNFTLLILLLSTGFHFISIPCQAQTARRASEINNNISAENVSSNENNNERSPIINTDDSANTKSTIISENLGNTTPVSDNQANTQSKFRIPISSRIFASPSMQQ